LPSFYAEQLGLSMATVGLMLLLARLFDVITDPIIGLLSDYAAFPFGRRKSFMLAGLLLLPFAVGFLFQPSGEVSGLYLLGWTLFTLFGWTLITLPYNAWGAELTTAYHGRSHVTGMREGFVILGTLIAASLPAVLGSGNDPRAALTLMMWSIWLLLPLTVLLALLKVPDPPPRRALPPWTAGLRLLWHNPPFWRLLIAYVLNGIANSLPATLFILFVTHVLAAPQWVGILLVVYFLAGVVSLPAWLWLSQHIGKHRAWAVSMLWACAVFIWVPFLEAGDVAWFMVICVLSGLSLGVDLALPAAIQADVVDMDSVLGGGERAGLFFGLWGMATKLALAGAVGIAFPLLSFVGFEASAEGPKQGLWLLSLLYGGAPVLIKVLAVALVWRFPLDQATHAALQAKL
jgi:Na+/melibiose symporter-like transporter